MRVDWQVKEIDGTEEHLWLVREEVENGEVTSVWRWPVWKAYKRWRRLEKDRDREGWKEPVKRNTDILERASALYCGKFEDPVLWIMALMKDVAFYKENWREKPPASVHAWKRLRMDTSNWFYLSSVVIKRNAEGQELQRMLRNNSDNI